MAVLGVGDPWKRPMCDRTGPDFEKARRPLTLPGVSTSAREDSFLARIVSTVSSSLELDEVLSAVVRLVTDASGVHACFVYLVEDDGRKLVLRAASEPYAHLAGGIELPRGEGIAWWAVEHREPAFVPEDLLDDPRVKY